VHPAELAGLASNSADAAMTNKNVDFMALPLRVAGDIRGELAGRPSSQ
jgi:hypothetical protein